MKLCVKLVFIADTYLKLITYGSNQIKKNREWKLKMNGLNLEQSARIMMLLKVVLLTYAIKYSRG